MKLMPKGIVFSFLFFISGWLVVQEQAELHLCNAIRQPGSLDRQVFLVEGHRESLLWNHFQQAHNLQQGCVFHLLLQTMCTVHDEVPHA